MIRGPIVVKAPHRVVKIVPSSPAVKPRPAVKIAPLSRKQMVDQLDARAIRLANEGRRQEAAAAAKAAMRLSRGVKLVG